MSAPVLMRLRIHLRGPDGLPEPGEGQSTSTCSIQEADEALQVRGMKGTQKWAGQAEWAGQAVGGASSGVGRWVGGASNSLDSSSSPSHLFL